MIRRLAYMQDAARRVAVDTIFAISLGRRTDAELAALLRHPGGVRRRLASAEVKRRIILDAAVPS